MSLVGLRQRAMRQGPLATRMMSPWTPNTRAPAMRMRWLARALEAGAAPQWGAPLLVDPPPPRLPGWGNPGEPRLGNTVGSGQGNPALPPDAHAPVDAVHAFEQQRVARRQSVDGLGDPVGHVHPAVGWDAEVGGQAVDATRRRGGDRAGGER